MYTVNNELGSIILYTATGLTYITDTFLDEVLSSLVKGYIIFTESPDLNWKNVLS